MHLFEAQKLRTDQKEMKTVKGKGNHVGSTVGKTVFFAPRVKPASGKGTYFDKEKERERYFNAHRSASGELRRLYGELRSESDAAWLFLMHIALLDDELFSQIPELYLSEGKSAEESVMLCRDYFFTVLCGGAGGENLLPLALDVEDVTIRILRALEHTVSMPELKSQTVLLSSLPLPSYVASNRRCVSGIVSSCTSSDLHLKELATSLSIPFIHTDEDISDSLSGKNALLDSARGYLYIDPDIETIGDFSHEAQSKRDAEALEDGSSFAVLNTEGKKISILAELDGTKDVRRFRPALFDGIGRFSSEELYLLEMSMPDEELLFEEYRRLAEIMPTKPVIIRAFNSSAPIRLKSIIAEEPDAPHAEFYVTYDATLRTQLRAVMRAAAYGSLQFVLPFVERYSDVFHCASIVEELSEELYDEECEFNPIPLGAMIGDVASALVCEKLLDECDFLIIDKERLTEALSSKSKSEFMDDGDSILSDALGSLVEKIQKNAQKKKKHVILSLGKSGSLEGLSQDILDKLSYISTGVDTLHALRNALSQTKKG